MSRWTLNRAGIINVYQYGDVTIPFRDGRLLLRGVNGSGKSTAMNMLLPFLLEADVRRIDAAGEQTSVLRSWMLAGREDPQPVGYLWLEVRRGDEHLTFGCGIRANRSTDRVTTWWFLTDRRPGIDLALVAARTPLSIDALRTELGAAAVHTHDQRASYRSELQRRLFGTTQLDQHLRLLHIVRNPRVSDRVDQDLPLYLAEALPQLSEPALDDAAQPLEDLDEHRRNVANLRRTATTLTALDGTYHDYVCTEVRAAVGAARASMAEARRLAATAARLAAELGEVTAARAALQAAATERERGIVVLDGSIDALKASDAYRAGTELHDRREQVRLANGAVATARRHHAAAEQRVGLTRQARQRAIADAADDHARLVERLSELRALLAASGVVAPTPDPPAQPVDALAAAAAGQDATGRAGPVPEASSIDRTGFERRLASVRAAAAVRREHVRETIALLASVEAAGKELDRAADALARARADATAAGAHAAAARSARDDAAGRLHDELQAWTVILMEHIGRHGLSPAPAAVPAAGELHAVAAAAVAEHRRSIDTVLDGHAARVAALDATLREHHAALADAEAAHDALLSMEVPEAPRAGWQVPGGSLGLAECVDVGPHLTPGERAGLEAALEASQLLAAEVDPGGGLLVDGRLVVRAGPAVSPSLAEHLVVTLPSDAERALAATVAAVLAAISVDPEDLERPGERTVVLTDGRFRCGPTAGRHAKAVAEHLGLTARRASLERRREAAAIAVQEARHALTEATAAHRSAGAARDEARALRRSLPEPTDVELAVASLSRAGEQLEQAVERVEDQTEQYGAAEDALADAAALLDRHAATAGLPRDAEGLTRLDHELRRVGAACERSIDGFAALARSVRNWRERTTDDGEAHQTLTAARLELDAAESELLDRSTQLAVLEKHVGRAHAEVVSAIERATAERAAAATALATARTELGELRERTGALQADAERATRDHDEADGRCVLQLDLMRRLFDVPGLAAAVAPTEGAAPGAVVALPAVERSASGLRVLTDAAAALLPPAERTVGADTVRQSLRQRRDALGAGWDAEDRQPDPILPLQVEVTGPLGRMPLRAALLEVGDQLRRAERLLTSQQDQALRNLLQGLIAREVAEKLLAARDLIERMNGRLATIRTSHGIGVSLRWRRADDVDPATVTLLELLAKPADLRTVEEDQRLVAALAARIAAARAEAPDVPYRILLGTVLDYRRWHQLTILVHRPGREPERLTRRTALSEGEKKMVSYLPLFAAVAASCDALADAAPDAPRFVLLDDAFAKVSEDNHPKLFGLMVELDLDFIATSERLWGTHATVPGLAICEVIRDASLGVIVLQHAEWDGHTLAVHGHG